MTQLRPTVGGVIRSVVDEILGPDGPRLKPEQRRTLKDLAACRTAALGGHVLGCPECGYQQIAYNSCGNRHCPTCQATAAARWLEARAAELLPVPYFHVVFTLPDVLDPLALGNPRVLYDLLLRCAAETLLELTADPKHLGARTGVIAVLHTWGQTLCLHPHAHCLVLGGGLSPDRTCWVSARPDFFLPVKVLSAVFRGKFLAALRAAFASGQYQVRAPGVGLRTHGLGRAHQASVRRPRGGLEVSGPIYPPGGDQQQPPARLRRWVRPLPLQGLRPWQQEAGHEAPRLGIRAAVPAPCTAGGIRADSLLRHPLQSLPTGESGVMSNANRH
jgi:Transposase zinc-binding domain/Putative transposase